MPLSLSDPELAAIMEAARPIPPRDRAKFLQAVSVELSKYPELGPGIVGRVVAKTQRQFFDPPNFHGSSGGPMLGFPESAGLENQ